MKRSIKILLFTIWIPYAIGSQNVIQRDSVLCFDRITASKILNDLRYCDTIIVQKNDSIIILNEHIQRQKRAIDLKSEKIKNKNTGLFLTALTNILLGLVAILVN